MSLPHEDGLDGSENEIDLPDDILENDPADEDEETCGKEIDLPDDILENDPADEDEETCGKEIDLPADISQNYPADEDEETCGKDSTNNNNITEPEVDIGEQLSLPNLDCEEEVKKLEFTARKSSTPFKRQRMDVGNIETSVSGRSNMVKFISPFYKGPTTFGGNSANNRKFNQESRNYKSAFSSPTLKLETSQVNSLVETRTSWRIREVLTRHKEQDKSQKRDSKFFPYARPCGSTSNATNISNTETNISIQRLENFIEGRRRLQRVTQSSRNLFQTPLKQHKLNFLTPRQVQDPSIYNDPDAVPDHNSSYSNCIEEAEPVQLPTLRFEQMSSAPNFDLNIQLPTPSGVKQRRIFIFNPPLPLPIAKKRQRRLFTFVPPIELEEDSMMAAQIDHPIALDVDLTYS